MAIIDIDSHVRHFAIERGIRSDLRPFREAVDAHLGINGAERVIGVWRRCLVAMAGPLVERWERGVSIDPFDGDVEMVVNPGDPFVTVEYHAPERAPDPMHLRSVVHLAEGLRPAMRLEGAVSSYELDREIGAMVRDVAARFPVFGCSDPREAASRLRRIRERHDR